MALQWGALRDAHLARNAPPDKAEETRLAKINAKLSVALWVGGLLFAAVVATQAGLWMEMGNIDGHLAQIGSQVNHIEQMLAQP